jgi:hypothetical protein
MIVFRCNINFDMLMLSVTYLRTCLIVCACVFIYAYLVWSTYCILYASAIVSYSVHIWKYPFYLYRCSQALSVLIYGA